MTPNDHNLGMTPNADNAGRALPSRRYTCEGCGQKWRRNNSPQARLLPPVCPSCHRDIMHFKRIEKLIPKIIYLKAKYPEL